MITKSETGTVSASLTNPLDRPIKRYVRAHITDGYVTLMREINDLVPLDPGETQQLAWSVTADDAAFERLILVKVIVRGRYPLPSQQGTCGILVVDAPNLTGRQVFGISLAISLLSMALGFGVWFRASKPLREGGHQAVRAMAALTVGVLAGMIVGLMGWWATGIIIFVVTLIGIGVIIGYFVDKV
ncbi:MAG TPA: hypothetical protein ENN19_03715 [Chloroflexi bacterium]|nr:hypothetical protein [Chloroflexota bacterium]